MGGNRNAEGYFDPTAARGIGSAEAERKRRAKRAKNLMTLMEYICGLDGFQIETPWKLLDKKTGKRYGRNGNEPGR